MHEYCIHARISPGVVYCTRTQCFYLRPDLIPTEYGRKNRGDECDVFSRKVRSLHKSLACKQVPTNAYILYACKKPLPSNENDLPDVISLLKWQDQQSKKGPAA